VRQIAAVLCLLAFHIRTPTYYFSCLCPHIFQPPTPPLLPCPPSAVLFAFMAYILFAEPETQHVRLLFALIHVGKVLTCAFPQDYPPPGRVGSIAGDNPSTPMRTSLPHCLRVCRLRFSRAPSDICVLHSPTCLCVVRLRYFLGFFVQYDHHPH
jgi:hypothetical protein